MRGQLRAMWLVAAFFAATVVQAEPVQIGDLLLTKEAAPLMSGATAIGEIPARTLLTVEQLRGDWALTTYESTTGKQRGWVSLRKVSLVRLVEATGAPLEASTPQSPAVTVATKSGEAVDWEAAALKIINAHREKLKLKPFTLDERLSNLARSHSESMAAKRVEFGHAGFEQRLATAEKLIPAQNASENVAFGSAGFADPAQTAFEGWLNSPGHRASMEGNFDLTGIGAAKNTQGEFYFTQIFLLRAGR